MYILTNTDPVEEGENITLSCFYKENYDDESISDFSAHF